MTLDEWAGILFLLLTILQALDAWTTHRILARGGRELNPIVAAAIRTIGIWPALIGKTAIVVGLGFLLMDWPWLLGALCVFYVAIVAFNFRSLKKMGALE